MAEGFPAFEKKPFVRKHLNTVDDKVDSRLNEEERALLNDVKDSLHLDADSTALKVCLKIAHNVLHGTFGKEMLRYIASPRRVRPGPK